MKIFRVKPDVEGFRHFLPVDESGLAAFAGLDGTPRSDTWSPPRVAVVHAERPAGNFFGFGGGFLITDEKATDALYTLFEMAGEMLPLPHGGESYTVLNVTQCIDCLDHDRTTWSTSRKGERLRIEHYEFSKFHLSETPIFKIPEEDRTAIYVVEGITDPDEEFREIAEREGLQGVIFEEVWSCADGDDTMEE